MESSQDDHLLMKPCYELWISWKSPPGSELELTVAHFLIHEETSNSHKDHGYQEDQSQQVQFRVYYLAVK